jgi:hypothetical protein
VREATPLAFVVTSASPLVEAVHVIPSALVATRQLPCPVAIQEAPFQVIDVQAPVNGEVDAVHVNPSILRMIVFVPEPPATHRVPFHAMARHPVVRVLVMEVHVAPVVE